MKKLLVLSIVLFCVSFANAGQSLDVVESQVETKKAVERIYVQRPEAFSRGIVNILTCWLEIPRCIINDNFIVLPGLGVITGAIKGPFYTVGRMGTGLIDFVTFGSLGNSLYNQENFPDYVWDADWLGKEEN